MPKTADFPSGPDLRAARVRERLTREQVAVSVHRGIRSVERWEKGHAIPPTTVRRELARLLKLDEAGR